MCFNLIVFDFLKNQHGTVYNGIKSRQKMIRNESMTQREMKIPHRHNISLAFYNFDVKLRVCS
jgi:hypothetical protein